MLLFLDWARFRCWLDELSLFNQLQAVLRFLLDTKLLGNHYPILQVLLIDELLQHEDLLGICLATELLHLVV